MRTPKPAPSLPDYRNRFNRGLWLRERKRDLLGYFESRSIVIGPIDPDPYWAKVPFVSIWRVSSLGTPGFDGWYGLAGDHPCDIVGINNLVDHPREILRYFSNKWLYAAQRLKQGDDYGDFRIEQIADRPKVGRLIEDRALRLQRWVDEASLWD